MQTRVARTCQPKLSIVTVSLNDCERLTHTLHSLSEIYNDARFEVIVADGGSADTTSEAVASFSGFENFKFYSAPDTGIYDGMNRGLAHASGDWVLFLNCGDVLCMGCDELFAFLSRFDQIVAPHILCFNYSAHFSGSVYRQLTNPSAKINLPTSHQAMIFSRSWLKQHPYDLKMRVAADFDAFLKADEKNVWFCPGSDLLTLVELDGVAFRNPSLTYCEYLVIIWRNKKGFDRIIRVGFLLSKYFVVIILRWFLPKSIYFKLRSSLL